MNPKLTINGLFFIWSAKVASNNNIEYFLTNIKYNNLKLIKKFLLLQDFQIFFYYLQKILYICCNHFDQCCKDFFYLAVVH